MRRLLVLSILALPALSLAIVRRHDKADNDYLNLGNQFPSVGRFEFDLPNNFVGSGSGVLIFDRWVITAAHLFDGNATGHKFTVGGNTYTAANKWIYPGWNGNLLPGFDLALVLLDNAVGNVAPAKLWAGDPANLIGQEITIVGFGRSGDGYSGAINNDKKKRGARNVVDGAPTFNFDGPNGDKHKRQAIIDFDIPDESRNTLNYMGSSKTPLDLEGITARGDSGGGWFLGDELFAVTSWGYCGNNEYGSVSSGVLIDREWVYQTVPEPASMIALAAGLGALALRRRRK